MGVLIIQSKKKGREWGDERERVKVILVKSSVTMNFTLYS